MNKKTKQGALRLLLAMIYALGGILIWGTWNLAGAQQYALKAEAEGKIDLAAFNKMTKEYLTRKHFHNYELEELPQDPNPAVCFFCHGSYPHQNAKMTRALLNMHTVFLACETCHFKFDPKERGRYGFRWYDGSDAYQASQRMYGTKYDPLTGRVLMESTKVNFKITPFLEWEGKYYMVQLRMDSVEAKEYITARKQFTPQQQAAIKSRLHGSIETKGRECGECHSVDSVIPFSRLGFEPEREKDLTGLSIVGMVEKYQKFYIPEIFKQKKMYEAPVIDEWAEK